MMYAFSLWSRGIKEGSKWAGPMRVPARVGPPLSMPLPHPLFLLSRSGIDPLYGQGFQPTEQKSFNCQWWEET